MLTDPADVTQTVGQKLWIFGGIEGTSPLINEDTSLKTWELADDENSWIRVRKRFDFSAILNFIKTKNCLQRLQFQRKQLLVRELISEKNFRLSIILLRVQIC